MLDEGLPKFEIGGFPIRGSYLCSIESEPCEDQFVQGNLPFCHTMAVLRIWDPSWM